VFAYNPKDGACWLKHKKNPTLYQNPDRISGPKYCPGTSCSSLVTVTSPLHGAMAHTWRNGYQRKFTFPEQVTNGWKLKLTFNSRTTRISEWDNSASEYTSSGTVWELGNKAWNSNLNKGGNIKFQVTHKNGKTPNKITKIELQSSGKEEVLCSRI